MKIKKMLGCFAIATVMAFGAMMGISSSKHEMRAAKAIGTEGAITVYLAGVSGWSTITEVNFAIGGNWGSASSTSGREYSYAGQYKRVYETNSTQNSLNLYFVQNEDNTTKWRHPRNNGNKDTNDSYINIGDVSLTPGHSYVVTFTSWGEHEGDNWVHAWFNYSFAEYTPSDCLIKGTVSSLSMSGDSTGQTIGNFSDWQYVIENIYLYTTDSFYFTISGWFDNGGKSLYSGLLFTSDNGNFKPVAEGCYTFYIQKEAIYINESAKEYEEDGVTPLSGAYLRHSTDDMGSNVVKLTTVVANSEYSLSKYTLTGGKEYKVVKYVNGYMSWCDINTVTCGDATYFNVYRNGNNVKVDTTAAYNINVTLSGSTWNYVIIDTASAWARGFLDSMQCNNDGASPLTWKEKQGETRWSWADFADAQNGSYKDLDDVAKNALYGATLEHIGTSVIDEAAKRHDVCVEHYGWASFMKNSSGVARANSATISLLNIKSSNSTIIAIVAITVASVLVMGGCFLLRKRREY